MFTAVPASPGLVVLVSAVKYCVTSGYGKARTVTNRAEEDSKIANNVT